MVGGLPVTGVDFKRIAAEDLPALIDFDNIAMYQAVSLPAHRLPPPLNLNGLQTAHSRGDIFEGASTEDGMVGYTWLEPKIDRLFLQSIAIHPEYRNKGLGTQFLRLMDQVAKARDYSKIQLTVDQFNIRGLGVFFKHGFWITDFQKDYFGPEYPTTDRIIMTKSPNAIPIGLESEQLIKVACENTEGIIQALKSGLTGVGLSQSDNPTQAPQLLFERA
jgi:ribosomal protein S18 acetylase RimI-like enzyme